MAKKKTPVSSHEVAPPAPPVKRRASTASTRKHAKEASAEPHKPTYDQIAEAAYLRFLNRGGSPGNDFDDWLAAEQDLLNRK